MESQHKQQTQNINEFEPFEIVHNARKNSKHLKSSGMKSRKNSTISLADEKQKKIKKKQRKLTEYLNQDIKLFDQGHQNEQKWDEREQNMIESIYFGMDEQKIEMQQKMKNEKEQLINEEKQIEDFYFQDKDVEKGIFQGLGDENSLGAQLDFDFFNPQNYRK